MERPGPRPSGKDFLNPFGQKAHPTKARMSQPPLGGESLDDAAIGDDPLPAATGAEAAQLPG